MQLYQVDAFTDQIFKGNPAGVCIFSVDIIKDDIMFQNIALVIDYSSEVMPERYLK